MKLRTTTSALLMTAACLTGCVSSNTLLESAHTLKKSQLDLAANYGFYLGAEKGETEHISNNFGVRLGYGLSDRVNLRLRYERLQLPGKVTGSYGPLGSNLFEVSPKFGLVPDHVALTLPFGLYTSKDDQVYAISPRLLFSVAPVRNRFDLTFSPKVDFLFDKKFNRSDDTLLIFSLGAGFSPHLDRWAFRPEIGLTFNPGETGRVWNFGIGLTKTLNGN